MNGISAYQENKVTTQSKGRLIVLLYEGAIKYLRRVVDEMEAGNQEAKARYFNKALDVLHELNVTLDMERGGQIATSLRGLYVFMIAQLNQANLKKDPQTVRRIIGLLEQLNEGWKSVTT
jgi:flagellar secretion chaperone FliS